MPMSDSASKPSRTPDSTSSPTLEIAHVLFTDIVGYSKLPMDEQEQLLMQFQDIVRQTVEFARAQADDQLIRLPTGDGMALVFFGDAEAPVRCAVEIGRSLRHQPALQLRMGIHTGPVYRVADINANRNVAGGGINIAQRVMDCGDAGHILVSSAEADVLCQVRAWSNTLHDLGEIEVKHGVRVHLYNLYTGEAGNPNQPKKIASQEAASLVAVGAKGKRKSVLIGAVAAVALASVAIWLTYGHNVHALGATDTVVLADFANTTGDAVFDDTLKQGLAVELAQSPFLNIVSEQKLRDGLKLIGRSTTDRLTPDIARDLCQRLGSKAYLSGSIVSLGSQYVIDLNAVNCQTGDSLVREQVQATHKEDVLESLDQAARELREKVGESLNTIQKFDVPLADVTTSSLDALKAYSTGNNVQREKGDFAALPFYKRAVELDPKFALAYASLGISYRNLKEPALAGEYIRRAYQLRGKVSERELFRISALYYVFVTHELEKAVQINEAFAQTYPRLEVPHVTLGVEYWFFGQYEKAAAQQQEALRLNPDNALHYSNLMEDYLCLDRVNEAKVLYQQALVRKFERPDLHENRYAVAFVEGDIGEMERQFAWAAGRISVEDTFLADQADTEAFFGRLRKARDFSKRALDSAERADKKETAAEWGMSAAIREVEFGNVEAARREVTAAFALASTQKLENLAALALARAGDSVRAEKMSDDLEKRFPLDTMNTYWLPTIRAAIQINRSNPAKATELLKAVWPYELSQAANLYPTYIRGLAYLRSHQGSEAEAEFQKILDHRGIVLNNPWGALAPLGLARAYTLEAKSAQGSDAENYKLRARAAYQDFLTRWKDADTDIPVLKQARTEYAKLK
jgi:class 3 adenylate cyclase/tetratricopeptide (TPR) repeat protein